MTHAISPMRRTLVPLAVAAAVLASGTAAAVASTAHTAVPRPLHNNTILTQKSIGGITIGAHAAPVRARFGKGNCPVSYECTYQGKGYRVTAQFGTVGSSKTLVVQVVQLVATGGKDAATTVRTSSGVGLGSSWARAKRGLHGATFHGAKSNGYFQIGTGRLHTTTTYFELDKGAVAQILIGRPEHVG